jgi:uncharacterized membrane protein (UPF0127 family)
MKRIINTNTKLIIADEVIIANSFYTRLKGLMFKEVFNDGTAMMITPCNMIHTFFMKFSIDIVFISKNNEVIDIIEDMKPGKVSHMVGKAVGVIEFPAGVVNRMKIQIGNFIRLQDY